MAKSKINNQIIFWLSVFISFSFSPKLFATGGGSSISGGDPLYHFLEATRSSLVTTTKVFFNTPDEQKIFCELPGLESDQVKYCRAFFLKVSQQFLQLNQGLKKTPFVIRDEPLFVEGAHGESIRVPARTLRGPQGDVEFDRELIHVMGPQNILMLISHEFGHKSEFEGRYIDDREVMSPFANGRELLDTVAAAILDLAKRRGLIGEHFGLYDHFQCIVSQGSGQPVGLMTSNPRTFYNEARTSYKTGFGYSPLSPGPYVYESSSNSSIQFKLKILDPGHCDVSPETSAQRGTELQLVRDYFPTTENPEPRQEIVETKIFPAFNPLCEKDPKELSMIYGTVKFSCKYYGTEGNTSTLVDSPAIFVE